MIFTIINLLNTTVMTMKIISCKMEEPLLNTSRKSARKIKWNLYLEGMNKFLNSPKIYDVPCQHSKTKSIMHQTRQSDEMETLYTFCRDCGKNISNK
ncbi:LEF5-like protein [Glossina pallidipes salivary gland hypertrophy virus]|uniref:LEF5-like protein n=1 Tax=Glossina hytrovirus (isolate Glossina pallidipes/Ethiopia/Seibersdorf/-) TaxID=379529 RepID=A0A109QTE5_GHVS|nr:LEF5-like protein [Glossina pallidipes salivary gland hypertrophy virus]